MRQADAERDAAVRVRDVLLNPDLPGSLRSTLVPVEDVEQRGRGYIHGSDLHVIHCGRGTGELLAEGQKQKQSQHADWGTPVKSKFNLIILILIFHITGVTSKSVSIILCLCTKIAFCTEQPPSKSVEENLMAMYLS